MKSHFVIEAGVGLIELCARDGSIRGHAIVDAEDAERLAETRWALDTATGYAIRYVAGSYRTGQVFVRMHREIMGLKRGDGLEVDHVNLNPLDNRRENLRIVTRAQQMQNLPAMEGYTSRFRGVCWNKRLGRWRATCRVDGKQHHLGHFRDEARANEVVTAFRREHMPYSKEAITS